MLTQENIDKISSLIEAHSNRVSREAIVKEYGLKSVEWYSNMISSFRAVGVDIPKRGTAEALADAKKLREENAMLRGRIAGLQKVAG